MDPATKDSSSHYTHRKTPRDRVVDDAALERAARLFRALGDLPRLRLLALLTQGEACVTELAGEEHEGVSTISQRLKVLWGENIVLRRRKGKHILYTLSDQHIMDLVTNALEHATEPPARGDHHLEDEDGEGENK